MTIQEILTETIERVGYPITRKEIIRAGYTPKEFMKELKEEIEKADDIKTDKNQKLLKKFFKAVEGLK